jgi:hypothetical protein
MYVEEKLLIQHHNFLIVTEAFPAKVSSNKKDQRYCIGLYFIVVPLGLEPRLF